MEEMGVRTKVKRSKIPLVHSQARRRITRVTVPTTDNIDPFPAYLPTRSSFHPQILISASLHSNIHLSVVFAFAARFLILGNQGFPKPVTAVQPFVAGRPVMPMPPHPPLATSINRLYHRLYSQGFQSSVGLFPCAIKQSFTRLKIVATVGVAALVPARGHKPPF